jgi:hypothetical protein
LLLHRVLAPPLLAVAIVASYATPALADGPTSAPSASPSPSPTPTRSSSPSPSPRASASPAPSDVTTAATASPSPDPEAARAEAEAARARDAALLADARSLAQIIDAQARVAQDELAGLDPQIQQVATDLDAVNAEIAALQAKSDARRTLRDRLEREALRLAALPSPAVPTDLSDGQRDALDEVRSLQSGLVAAQTKLAERAELLNTLKGSVEVRADRGPEGARARRHPRADGPRSARRLGDGARGRRGRVVAAGPRGAHAAVRPDVVRARAARHI